MLKFLLIVVFAAVLMCYSSYANPKWKCYEKSSNYGNAIVRSILGLAAWIFIISFCIGLYVPEAFRVAFFSFLIVFLFLVRLGIRLSRDGYRSAYLIFLLLMASIGTWSRIFLAWTLIGIPLISQLKDYAEAGEDYWEIYMETFQGYEPRESVWKEVSDILDEQTALSEKRKQERMEMEESQRKENEGYIRKKVWKETGRTDVQFDEDSARWKYSDEDWRDSRRV